ncbi:PD-(D/E)XK motif protein [Aestuariimicrobium sp. T2.26MG-19.2B]|uniref:PD-(D/E)XK motif protein n=1 Tax=Aestuariimicrobium sp. T2.26MG-19.2B TaxID=3040679 RepID=UPI0024777D90|nr:PD-(D/E)XK motif protein [Aestuariimicrobium sp. T2.26MG-19.2B]CAI9405066.1 hypothetical protein AESSP_01337 [Aestuariimicrobium sp. T2.26MG-19.2B]
MSRDEAAVAAWRQLRAEVWSLEGEQLNATQFEGPSLLGVGRDGAVHVLLPSEEALQGSKRFGSVSISTREWVHQGTTGQYVDMMCSEPTAEAAFAWVVSETLVAVDQGDSALSAGLRILRLMKDLFREPQDMAEEAVLGLFGEVTVLERLIGLRGEPAVSLWGAVSNRRHDFMGPHGSVEVKTTKSLDVGRVVIHGLWQGSPTGPTTLAVLQVEESPGGQSLAELVEGVLDSVTDRGSLLERLLAAGYRHDSRRAKEMRLHVVATRAWRMDDPGFPLVRYSELPVHVRDGVSELAYAVAIGSMPASARHEDFDEGLAVL